MKHPYNKQQLLRDLVFRYELLTQKDKTDGFDEKAFLELANFYEVEHSPEKALEIVNHGLSQFDSSADLHLCKAKLLLRCNEPDTALELLDLAMSNEANDPVDIQRFKAQAYALKRQYDKAQQTLDLIHFELAPNAIQLSDIWFLEAWIQEKEDRLERAFESLCRSLESNPLNQAALERMWIIVEFTRKHVASVKIHQDVLDLQPYSYQAWYNLGHAYYSLNEYEQAKVAFEYAFLINKKFELAYRDFAEVCFDLKQYDEALNCLLEAQQQFEPDSDMLARIGECYKLLGETSKAKVYLFRALNLDQRNDEIYFHIGTCYAMDDHNEGAIHFFKQAIKLEDTREDYLFELGRTYRKLGRYKKAATYLRAPIDMASEVSMYWVEIIRLFIEQKKFDKALKLVTEALEHTYGADLIYCKTVILYTLKREVEAFEYLAEALQENHSEHRLLFELDPKLRKDNKVSAIIRYYKEEV